MGVLYLGVVLFDVTASTQLSFKFACSVRVSVCRRMPHEVHRVGGLEAVDIGRVLGEKALAEHVVEVEAEDDGRRQCTRTVRRLVAVGVALMTTTEMRGVLEMVAVVVVSCLVGGNEQLVAIPSVVLDEMHKLDDELALLVLLRGLERLLVLPAERRLARLAVDVGDRVQAGEQVALLGGARAHVDHLVEQVGATLRALKRLRDQVVVLGQLRATVRARVCALRLWQVDLECFAHFCCCFL